MCRSAPSSRCCQLLPAAALNRRRSCVAATTRLAAGYVLYGPQTSLVLTLGAGTDIFTLDRASGAFVLTGAQVQIPPVSNEFAINASNARHWSQEVRQCVRRLHSGRRGAARAQFQHALDRLDGGGGVTASWSRGGVYIYPGDAREGYRSGRLRLVYEANPIAFLIEQAGGAASTGRERMLDRVPRMLHERVPLIFGSRDEVARLRSPSCRSAAGRRANRRCSGGAACSGPEPVL